MQKPDLWSEQCSFSHNSTVTVKYKLMDGYVVLQFIMRKHRTVKRGITEEVED
jgi:hypothetical protein